MKKSRKQLIQERVEIMKESHDSDRPFDLDVDLSNIDDTEDVDLDDIENLETVLLKKKDETIREIYDEVKEADEFLERELVDSKEDLFPSGIDWDAHDEEGLLG